MFVFGFVAADVYGVDTEEVYDVIEYIAKELLYRWVGNVQQVACDGFV